MQVLLKIHGCEFNSLASNHNHIVTICGLQLAQNSLTNLRFHSPCSSNMKSRPRHALSQECGGIQPQGFLCAPFHLRDICPPCQLCTTFCLLVMQSSGCRIGMWGQEELVFGCQSVKIVWVGTIQCSCWMTWYLSVQTIRLLRIQIRKLTQLCFKFEGHLTLNLLVWYQFSSQLGTLTFLTG